MTNKKEKKIFELEKKVKLFIAIKKLPVSKIEVIKASLTHCPIQMTMCYFNKSVDDKYNDDVLI